jgi:hypothetical protein
LCDLLFFFVVFVWIGLDDNAVKPSDSDTIFMVVILVTGVGGVFILFALMALCYR